MSQRKQNISRWYLLGLAAILTVGCMMVSVGTTLARYRVDNEKTILFEPKTPVAVALGTVDGEGNFDPAGTIAWTEQTITITPEEGDSSTESQTKKVYALNFAVANYISEGKFQEKDLTVRIRLVGSLDAWNETTPGTVVLTDGVTLEDGTQREFTATVTGIPENTALYHSFGVGWVFQFVDENGQELTWTLEGGKLSCQSLNITMDAAGLSGTSLLQLQIVGETTE